jgi:hypothetical protein
MAEQKLSPPKPGVDYSKLAAEMPEIRGQLDFIDHALFEASPGVFATLIDLKARLKRSRQPPDYHEERTGQAA